MPLPCEPCVAYVADTCSLLTRTIEGSAINDDFIRAGTDDALATRRLQFRDQSRTVRSSMIVFTATHSGSLSDEIVGRCSAGSSARIRSRSAAAR